MISLGSVRAGAKVLAQNVPVTGGTGVNLLLTDPGDFTAAVRQAIKQFDSDRENTRTVDAVISAAGFRVVLKGTGALAAFAGADAWSMFSLPKNVWYPFDVTSAGQDPMDSNLWRIVQDPGPKTVLELFADTFAVGQTLRLEFSRPHGLTEAPNTVTAPASACSAALASPVAAGNVTNGAHTYKVTFVTAHGETTPGSASASVTVVNNATNGQVALTGIPESDDYGVIARRIYRTTAADAAVWKLVGTIEDNDSQAFTDNVADGSLGAVAPTTNTAGGVNSVDDEDEEVLTMLAASIVLQMAANKAAQNTGNTGLPNDVVDRRSQSDIFRSRAKELRELYGSLVGRGSSVDIGPHSAFGDLDSNMSDGRGFLFHRG